MTLSDTLTVALVLVLLIGSIALYLYTRIQQAEQKISLLEGILLDMKMSSEIKSYDELPAVNITEEYAPYEEYQSKNQNVTEVEEYKSAIADAITDSVVNDSVAISIHDSEIKDVSYETMTLKDLQSLAKTKGIATSSMKKGQLVEALKAHKSDAPELSLQDSSFLETSTIIE